MFVRVNGELVRYESVVNLMDDELRESLHNAIFDAVTAQEFVNEYCLQHKKRFGEEFTVS